MKLYFAHGCFCLIPRDREAGEGGGGEAQECPGARREGVSLMGGCRLGQERSSLQGRDTHPRRARYPGRAQPSLGRRRPEPCSKLALMGPATLLALRPLLAAGTRQTRSTRSLCHTQSGMGRGRRRRTGLGFLGQPKLLPAALSSLPHVGLKRRVRGFSSPGSKGGGWGWSLLPSSWESGLCKQKAEAGPCC